MKCKIPEISWHNRDPVLSVDIQPKTIANNYYRLASGGTDAHVLIWYMKLTSTGEHGDIDLDLAADLTRHQRAVNAVKWSPNGELLASGDDESVVFIWKLKSDSEPVNILDSTNEQDKEVWITLKVLRGHMEDIYDLSWAPNSQFLVSGSVDNSAMVWDVQKGKSLSILNDHKGFVQGVAWDPKNQYIATLSTDRYLRIFDIQTKKVLYRVSKGTLPVSEENNLYGKRMRLFHDDTLQTFFRRLTFTPDGKLLLTPAGVTDYDGCTRPINTTYAFSRYGFRQPALVLPCPDQYTVAVKCCPVLYKLKPFNAEKNSPVVPLPYRMIFAVATKSSVYFYDTQQKQPFALISNIHYTRLTDITWSNDGRIVVVSSTDGFCSLITFEQGELGEEYENSEAVLEAALAQVTKKTKKQKDVEAQIKSRKPSTDDSGITKENTNAQKEPQLAKIVEQENKEKEKEEVKPTPIAIKRKPENEDQSKGDDTKKATPIAIKRKPVSIESDVQDGMKANPIAVKRRPTESNDNKLEDKKETAEKMANSKPVKESTPENKVKINVDDTKLATPIAIKRKPNTTEIDVKDNRKANPIAIKRKPGLVENTSANDNKSEEKATPIAIKSKSETIESKDDKTVDKKQESEVVNTKSVEKSTPDTTELEDDKKVNPIAVKRKPGPVEDKAEAIATPIAIKRKPGQIEVKENKLKDKKEESKVTTSTPAEVADVKPKSKVDDTKLTTPIEIKENPDTTEKVIKVDKKPGPVKHTITDEKKANEKVTPIDIKHKPGQIESKENKPEDKKVAADEVPLLKPVEESTPPKVATVKSKSQVDDTKQATPIAIKRKSNTTENDVKEDQKVNQIATKRKTETIEVKNTNADKVEEKTTEIEIKDDKAMDKKEDSEEGSTSKPVDDNTLKQTAVIPSKVLATEIIIDKEILSSEEKFESPEKKSRPATPIMIRRHPRTPNSTTQTPTSCQTPTSMSTALKTQLDLQNQSPLSSISKEVKTPRQNKKATPIAVRRTPRAIITTPSIVNSNSMVEEAMDAWPLTKDTNSEDSTIDSSIKKSPKESGIAPLPISEATCERTEDIRLVYEETNEETPVQESLPKPMEVEDKKATTENKTDDTAKQQTPSGKTPRRVALKTISTPKSKKKLLD